MTFDEQTMDIPSVKIPLLLPSQAKKMTLAFWFKLTTTPKEGNIFRFSKIFKDIVIFIAFMSHLGNDFTLHRSD